MENQINKQLDIFFRKPEDFSEKKGVLSTLFLLRRDIQTCFGIDPNTNRKIDFEALFPGTIAILAGIDLLAKFVYNDKPNEVGIRYRNYVENYIDKEHYMELYQLRNALLHSFGLYSESGGKTFRFVLYRGADKLIQDLGKGIHYVDIELLRNKFENSIDIIQQEIRESESLQKNFLDCFAKYGALKIK
jgi:hypothetical protein